MYAANAACTISTFSCAIGYSFGAGVIYRVLPPEIAALTRETMKGVTDSMETKYAPPPEGQEWRYTIFGKSGTAKIPTGSPPEGKRRPRGCPGYLEQYRTSFIAGGPIDDPRLVVLVVMDVVAGCRGPVDASW